MRRFEASLFLALLALASCCCFQHAINAEAVRPLVADVVSIHDAYIQADPTISKEAESSFLAESAVLLSLFNANVVLIPENAPLAKMVCNRTREYILTDPASPPGGLQERVYLRSVDALQELFVME